MPTDAPPASIREGDVLDGRWRIEKKLGQGGMGSVFAARDLELDRPVAVKALALDLCEEPELVARFDREGRAAAKLDHPGIVPVLDVGRHGGRPYIVMRLLDGESLAHRLARGPLPPAEVLPIVRQVCAALAHLHLRGLVHRDVKPGNLFLGPDGRVTLLDFGVIHDAAAREKLTRTGVLIGTAQYVAPEQATGDAPVDGRADLYALGVSIFELLAGRPPFDRGGEPTLVRQHQEASPPRLTAMVPTLPPALDAVIARAMAKRREDRFPDAQALLSAFEAAVSAEQTIITEPDSAPGPPDRSDPAFHDVTTEREAIAREAARRATSAGRGNRPPPGRGPPSWLVPLAAVGGLAVGIALMWLLGSLRR